MPEQVRYGDEPALIEVAPDLKAHRVGRHYTVRIPYNTEASNRIRMLAHTWWDRSSKAWTTHAMMHDALRRTLEEIDEILGKDRHKAPAVAGVAGSGAPGIAAKAERFVVLSEDGHAPGDIASHKRKKVVIDRLGTPFVADGRFAKWGKADWVGRMVRYAYHRPASPEEIATWEARHAPEPAREEEPSP